MKTEIELPDKWLSCSVGDMAKFIDYRGRTPKKTAKGVPLITAKNIRNGFISRQPREYIAEHDYDSWMTRGIPRVGDVVITTEAPMGNVALVDIDEKFALAQRAICLQTYGPQIGAYLHYALRSPAFQKSLTRNATGSTVSGIKAATLKSLPIPLPPFAEQQVIAEILDTLLAKVDSTKARLERIPDILKRFRQSVLASAVSGKLTREFRTSHSNTDEWDRVTLSDVVVSKPRNGWSPKGVDYETPTKNLTLSSTTSGHFIDGCYKYIDAEVPTDSYLWVKNGDILIQRANTLDYVGVSALYEGPDDVYIYPDLMMKISPSLNILGKFLHYSLLENKTRVYFRENATGTSGNMPKINQGVVSNTPVLLPPLDEQTEIVRRVEQLFAYADKIEQQAQAALDRVNNLTQSILAKAFRGELTADWRAAHPELISGENSAEALLAKIKAEREAMQPTKSTRKRKAAV